VVLALDIEIVGEVLLAVSPMLPVLQLLVGVADESEQSRLSDGGDGGCCCCCCSGAHAAREGV